MCKRRSPQRIHVGKIIIIAFLLFQFQESGISQIVRVWALGDGEKVYRNEINHPAKNGNFIWDGHTIHLKGLYNEVLAFQVIVETARSGARAIELVVEAPMHPQSHKVIGGNTLKYGPQGTIEIFSEHYLHVSDSTAPLWFYGSLASQPKKMTGWIPDALIPVNVLPGMGGLPLDVPPVKNTDRHFSGQSSQNQGFWVDIHLPRDREKFPPGTYVGNVQVWERNKLFEEFTLEIILLPAYMPDENHSNIWMFSSDLKPYFKEMTAVDIDKMIKFEAHRHRISMEGGFEANRSPFDRDMMTRYKVYLDGSAFTPGNGYHGPGEGQGERIFPIGMYGSPVMGNTKSDVQKQADLWVGWFAEEAPEIIYFWYIIDEPHDAETFAWIRERAGWIKSNSAAGRSLPVFTTSHYREDLDGSIDIWAAYDGVNLNRLQLVRDKGGDYWFYNGKRPRTGSLILEAPAVDLRVNCWILYKYGINEWFIWESTHWQHNHQGPKAHLHQNMFISPLTFINETMEFANGDGVLFYPGKMPFYPDQNRGLNQLFASIRLKNIRRGQQDVNLMWLAEQKAGRESVLNLINTALPAAMSEVRETDKVPWSEQSSDYDKIRDELLKMVCE
jgi:hypothetical protein